jgi:uncharacterized protein DUF4832/uncharacterized protein DUF4874
MTGLGTTRHPQRTGRISRAVAVAATCAMAVSTAGVAGAQGAGAAAAAAVSVETTYQPSTANIANPERGFYNGPADCATHPFDEATLREARRMLKTTLVRCVFYLHNRQAQDLTTDDLNRLRERTTTAERLGFKLVLRFAYEETSNDAKIQWVERHLDQLKPILQEKAHVIHVMESGFVGSYGEGYYTDNYGDSNVISDAQWLLRKRIVDKILTVLPANKQTQVRTVPMKRSWYGPTVPLAGPTNPAAARVGLHNDCFLGKYNDEGTYRDDADKTFLASDSKYVVVGGEACGTPDPAPGRLDCANVKAEFARFHWTHINKDWGIPIINKWTTGGCRDEIDRRLGYRLSLAGASFPTSIPRGSTFLGQVVITNTGWAAPISNRPVQLGLRNTATGSVSYLAYTGVNLKSWYPGSSVTLAQHFGVINPGTYELVLRLPDASSSLSGPKPLDKLDPDSTAYPYNIQLANPGVWDKAKGYNKLGLTLRVT